MALIAALCPVFLVRMVRIELPALFELVHLLMSVILWQIGFLPQCRLSYEAFPFYSIYYFWQLRKINRTLSLQRRTPFHIPWSCFQCCPCWVGREARWDGNHAESSSTQSHWRWGLLVCAFNVAEPNMLHWVFIDWVSTPTSNKVNQSKHHSYGK